jgi:hypothetical protein
VRVRERRMGGKEDNGEIYTFWQSEVGEDTEIREIWMELSLCYKLQWQKSCDWD